jgi:hypothetical protein
MQQHWFEPMGKNIQKAMDYEKCMVELNTKVPFDLFLLNFIFMSDSSEGVRLKALKVLLKDFS